MRNAYIQKIAQIIKKQGGVNSGCRHVSEKLNGEWQPNHIYKVYRGLSNPSKRLITRLNSLRSPKPTRKRNRIKIEGTKEQVDYWKSFTMDERIEALNSMRKDCE